MSQPTLQSDLNSGAVLASAPPCATPADPVRWFKDEVHPHDAQLKAWLRGQFPAVRDVDDVVQESYLRIWKARLTRPIHSTKSFLFQIARHLAIDTLRRRQTAPVDSSGDLSQLAVMEERPDPAAALSYHEKVSLVADALARLPDRCREVFILRKFQGVPQKEIAARLAISERTVESQVTRGMKLLEKYLRERGLDGFIVDEK